MADLSDHHPPIYAITMPGIRTGDSFESAASASFLIARSGCVAGTRVSGDISISIEDCLVFSPRIVNRKVSSMRQMSIPGVHFSVGARHTTLPAPSESLCGLTTHPLAVRGLGLCA